MADGCTKRAGLTEREEREITAWVLKSVATEPETWMLESSYASGSVYAKHQSGLSLYIAFDWQWGEGYVRGASPPTERFQFFRLEHSRAFFGLIRRTKRVYNAVLITNAFHDLRHRTDGEAIRQFRDMTAPKFAAVDEIKRNLVNAA